MMKKWMIGLILAGFVATAGAESYSLDKTHAAIDFKVRHLGLSKVKGAFKDFDAKVGYAGSVDSLTLEVTIQAASVDTANAKRDAHLRKDDFFGVETHPEITFKSTGVKADGDDVVMVGDLTMKGVTQSIEFPIEVNGPIDSPFEPGVSLIGLNFEGKVNRHDYDIKAGMADAAVGKKVSFEVSLEAKK